MYWFAWRQLRLQTLFAAGLLALIGLALTITGFMVAGSYADTVAVCDTDCVNAVKVFLLDAHEGAPGAVYTAGIALVYVGPALIGAFWGAPLIARELETGTYNLAWGQSASSSRWLAAKLAVTGTATAAVIGVLSWAVTAWAGHIDAAEGNRITPLIYSGRGVAPVAYALFAFTLGAALGALIRRTVPAMAATLVVYTAVLSAFPLWIREHLVAPVHTTTALDMEHLTDMMRDRDGGMEVLGEVPDGSWLLFNRTLSPDGSEFTGPSDPTACSMQAIPGQCEEWLGTLGLRQDMSLHPSSHFWSLQWTEAGIFLGLAVLLAGFCFWWLRRRAV